MLDPNTFDQDQKNLLAELLRSSSENKTVGKLLQFIETLAAVPGQPAPSDPDGSLARTLAVCLAAQQTLKTVNVAFMVADHEFKLGRCPDHCSLLPASTVPLAA